MERGNPGTRNQSPLPLAPFQEIFLTFIRFFGFSSYLLNYDNIFDVLYFSILQDSFLKSEKPKMYSYRFLLSCLSFYFRLRFSYRIHSTSSWSTFSFIFRQHGQTLPTNGAQNVGLLVSNGYNFCSTSQIVVNDVIFQHGHVSLGNCLPRIIRRVFLNSSRDFIPGSSLSRDKNFCIVSRI